MFDILDMVTGTPDVAAGRVSGFESASGTLLVRFIREG